MSAPAPASAAPSLLEGVVALLRVLARGVRGGELVLTPQAGHSAVAGVTPSPLHLPCSAARGGLSDAVLALLERNGGYAWGVHLAAFPLRGLDALSVSALAVELRVPLAYVNPRDPAAEAGRRWCFPPDHVRAAFSRLAESPAPPTLVVEALPRLVGVWALNGPSADWQRLRRLSVALAERCGAQPPGKRWPGDTTVPLPGTSAEAGRFDEADAPLVEPARIYTPDDLDAALAAAKE